MEQSYVNSLQSMVTEDLKKGMDKIYKHLVQAPPMGSLPETIFRDYFLPFFTGQRQSDKWVVEWVSIAGTPSSEVSIMDAAGNELFRVPPIVASSHILMNGHKGDLSAVFAQHERLSAGVSEAAGMRFLMTELGARQEAATNQKTPQMQIHERWQAILARYGLVPKPMASTSAQYTSDGDYFE